MYFKEMFHISAENRSKLSSAKASCVMTQRVTSVRSFE